MVLLQRILIGASVVIFPLLVYCLLLIGLNSRRRASLIPGTWDFAGVLLATSGFLLGGGSLILAGLNAGWRRYVMRGSVADWRSLSGEGDAVALAIWALFFGVLIVGSAVLIWVRRRVTVLYNLETEKIWQALEWIFDRQMITWSKRDTRYDLHRQRNPNEAAAVARMRVQVLPSQRNVTLHWEVADPGIREDVEADLTSLLADLKAPDNPAVGWLMTAATTFFGLVAVAMLFLIFTLRLR